MKYHLRHWARASGRTSNPLISALEIERLYVNGEDGVPLGYIERRMKSANRSNATYYDQHRSAKGDTTETISDVVTWTIGENVLGLLKDEVSKTSPKIAAAMQKADEIGMFLLLKPFARGISWCASKRQREELRKQADAFQIEL